MTERTMVHVGLHYVLPPEERDAWRSMSQASRSSWRNSRMGVEQLAEVGEQSEYLVELTDEEIEAARAANNTKYVLPVIGVSKQGEIVGEVKNSVNILPAIEEEVHQFHRATDYMPTGEGVVVFHLDTGCSDLLIRSRSIKVASKKNFVSETFDATDVTDVDGHGTMTMSILHVPGAEYHIFKVLGDDGRGSSMSITAAIREAAAIAERDRSKKYILSGSVGGAPGVFFPPYHDACALAESFGVICRFSAGNDGQHAISPPANWTQGRASIAFNRTVDRRASFSNYEDWAGLATVGERIRVMDRYGNYVYVNGTSFSLPLWNHYTTTLLSAFPEKGVLAIDVAEMSSCRDSGENVEEESHGVYDYAATYGKLSPQNAPYYPHLPRISKSEVNDTMLGDLPSAVLTTRGNEKGVYLRKES